MIVIDPPKKLGLGKKKDPKKGHNEPAKFDAGSLPAIYKEGRGRLPKITSREQLWDLWLQYVDATEKRNCPLTMVGLANCIGVSRKTLYTMGLKADLEGTSGEIGKVVHYIKSLVEQSYEENMLKGKSIIGHIFSLKENYDWKDSKQINIKKDVTITEVLDGIVIPGKEDAIDVEFEELTEA